MADEENALELPESSKRVALGAMTELTLRFLIAEVARINRTPNEAEKFVENLRQRLQNFNDRNNSKDTDIDRAWKKEMDQFIFTVFSGIAFKENDS